ASDRRRGRPACQEFPCPHALRTSPAQPDLRKFAPRIFGSVPPDAKIGTTSRKLWSPEGSEATTFGKLCRPRGAVGDDGGRLWHLSGPPAGRLAKVGPIATVPLRLFFVDWRKSWTRSRL